MSSILTPDLRGELPPLLAALDAAYLRDETEHVRELLLQAELSPAERDLVMARATELVARVRARADKASAVERFMREYDLSSEEGVLLMCVAEALLRIPDKETADRLISDKLGEADWEAHLGKSDSVLVNASTWGLMLTGKLIELAEDTRRSFGAALKRLIARAGEPIVRLAVRQAMRIMGHQFVMGQSIEEAIRAAESKEGRRWRYSFDMLGEAALTEADAQRYLAAYRKAVEAVGAMPGERDSVFAAPSVSVKLSALHPRYERAQRERVLAELVPRLSELVLLAKAAGIGLTVDAEEADRLELSLEVFERVFADERLRGYEGFGLAVQAYQKRAPFVIDWLAELARRHQRRIPLRLVKGAYWDSEIKRAQEQGLAGYPVFTRKLNTDVSYLACAKRLLAAEDCFYPQFATHNAHTIAAVHHLARGRPFEFQRLFGMGEALYEEVIGEGGLRAPCRVYAPVGSHEDLLPYLVRRLLENGANTSFVNRISDESRSIPELVADPVETVKGFERIPHPRIPLPADIYLPHRKNSRGLNLASELELKALAEAIARAPTPPPAMPLVAGYEAKGTLRPVYAPRHRQEAVGAWLAADEAAVERALENALAAQRDWDRLGGERRAAILERAADLIEAARGELVCLLVREAGKTIPDALAEVREAADFCRYYAAEARRLLAQPQALPGPTGERNELSLHGRGLFVCISPWNFPLAIFTGQVAAALVAGNTVIAKPAEQTNLIGHRAVRLLHEAGVPPEVLQFLPGEGHTVGKRLTSDPRVAGVAFTGSTETAWAIQRALAARDAPIAVLVAETGGLNAMIADSSALPEQLIKDTLLSAFGSAGQRCSAARILLVQEDIAEKVLKMLAGAMAELRVGDPGRLRTDVGPIIDEEARENLIRHQERMEREAKLVARASLSEECDRGVFFAPVAFELQSLKQIRREVFGPILHVVRYKARELEDRLDELNEAGYGLTLGIHSRIDSTIERILARVRAGNRYVNRSMIGAVVGVQPFGGEGLSGTGPKAGGPHYLPRFCVERTLTINTTASGGNASLLTLGD
ncbi:MAG: bifunctional protein PutA [Lysobacterales bacterium]|jgi:RHH-type proline utilization regulon transcriptional repressor/proline dehydrogenase/delta 1-pyrroline-5-carboxylate dehydrogenase|nr:MAG: bifunctional protein PutA [Xanthomonadales bacterium]